METRTKNKIKASGILFIITAWLGSAILIPDEDIALAILFAPLFIAGAALIWYAIYMTFEDFGR